MAKLTRLLGKVFSSAAANIGQFGSGQLGTKIITTDPAVVQQLSAFTAGWSAATLGANKFPPIEEMNGVQFVSSYQNAYILQEGVPEYDATTTYYIGGIVKKTGTFQLYGSIVDNNVGNALTDATKWAFLLDLSAITSNVYTGGTTTGSANAQVLASVVPGSGFSLRNGVTVTATAGFSNSGATTLDVAGTGPVDVTKLVTGVLVPLVAGDITVGNNVNVQYNSTAGDWVLQDVSLSVFLQAANNLSDVNNPAVALANLGGIGTLLLPSGAIGTYADAWAGSFSYSSDYAGAFLQANSASFPFNFGTWKCLSSTGIGGWGGFNTLWRFQRIA